jgi:hypothetical protein
MKITKVPFVMPKWANEGNVHSKASAFRQARHGHFGEIPSCPEHPHQSVEGLSPLEQIIEDAHTVVHD